MTKEDKITEAWGALWQTFTYSAMVCALRNNGYVAAILQNGLNKDFTEWNQDLKAWRPKLLKGIENNNGWIKIESEADLPKENCQLHVYPNYLESDIFFFYNDELSKDELITNHTHYQPIIKPQPPIY